VTRQAIAEGAAMTVAVGGDGTVAAVATALYGMGLPLGIIPAGSTNLTARELGIPTDPAATVALLFGPQRHVRLDVGLCGNLCFLHMAGAGLVSRMFAAANPARKRQIGWLAYVPPALHALPPSPGPLHHRYGWRDQGGDGVAGAGGQWQFHHHAPPVAVSGHSHR
jgi:diacylglycerol kinase family enzyme